MALRARASYLVNFLPLPWLWGLAGFLQKIFLMPPDNLNLSYYRRCYLRHFLEAFSGLEMLGDG